MFTVALSIIGKKEKFNYPLMEKMDKRIWHIRRLVYFRTITVNVKSR